MPLSKPLPPFQVHTAYDYDPERRSPVANETTAARDRRFSGHRRMSVTSSLLGIGLMAPMQWALWHGARLGRWPGSQTPLSHRTARIGGFGMLLIASLAAGLSAESLLMALLLPLAAGSVAGILYVPLIHAWPRLTLPLCAISALAGGEWLLLAWMQSR